jgi:hypothetical protein
LAGRFIKLGAGGEVGEGMVGWQLWLTAVPLPLILYVAYAAIGWPISIKQRVASELEWITERGCATCPLSKVCLPLYQILISLTYIAFLLTVYGIPSVFFGSRGAFIGAVVFSLAIILLLLPEYIKIARRGQYLPALLASMYQVFAVLAMTLLWLYSPTVFALVVAADNALRALAAWWLVKSCVQGSCTQLFYKAGGCWW